MAAADIEQLVQSFESLASDSSDPLAALEESQRARLHDALQRLTRRVESPHDVVYKICYSPNLLIVSEVACNLKIFETLVATKPEARSAAQLADVTGASEDLTGRIARWLAGHGLVDEADEDRFIANRATEALSRPGFRGGVKHYVYTTLPPLLALPDFLKSTHHANPADLTNCPFQRAFNTSLPKFEYQKSLPEISSAFGLWMQAQHKASMSWLDVVDFLALVGDAKADGEGPVFVDVGGGIGHQCAKLGERFPRWKGRMVLQDERNVLENALQTEGVEKVEVDFWREQPVKGSRAYYFRYIMHDYPDERCRVILNHTIAAMDADSVILIDDVVLPDKGAHPYSLDKDIVMMVNFGAMERTTSQWVSLAESCGLQIVQAATYNPTSGEAIQVLRKQNAA